VVGKVTGSEFVVDSSKEILRYYLLKQYRPDDVFLVINSRDPVGYAYSYFKQGIPPSKSLKSLKKYHKRVSLLLKSSSHSYLATSYESVAKKSEKFLCEIAHFLNLDWRKNLSEKIDLSTYHIIAGNPMRYKTELTINYDNEWLSLPQEQKEAIDTYIKKYKITRSHSQN
jgi:hypothetical protein